MITILYFGVLKQQLATESEQIGWSGGTGRELVAFLRARGSEWADALDGSRVFRIAIDKRIAGWDEPIPDGAEVGLLPPVTGG
ncbi:MoaD/ThiS family protein [Neisseria sp.]|uniref:MoaD/ThiS family protein n=1 Tax=Neisseria sp. TaxID=192066 RepID=UPI00359F72C3